jgi:hypothetical protein
LCPGCPPGSIGGHGKPNLTLGDAIPGERVWCAENDLGTLIVRRNGKVAIVGNCIGRLHRDGQGNTVMAYFLVSDVGSDPVMADVLNVKRMQGEPLRNPDADLFETSEDTTDRVKRLAREILSKRQPARNAA